MTADSHPHPLESRPFIRPAALFICFGVCAWVSFKVFGGQHDFLDIWPPSALAIAIALPAWGTRRQRPWLFVAVFLGYLAAAEATGVPHWIALSLAVVSGIEMSVACGLMSLSLSTFDDLKQVRNVVRFAVVVALVVAGCAELGAYPVAMLIHSSVPTAWMHIAEGDGLGILALFPALFFLTSGHFRSMQRLRPHLRSGLFWVVVFTGMVTAIFYQTKFPLLFLVFPPLVGLIFALGTEGAAYAVISATLIGGWFTDHGFGPVNLMHGVSHDLRLQVFQFFIATAFAVALPIGALLDERLLADRQILEAQTIYSTLIGHTNELIILASHTGDRKFVSRAVNQLLGWTEREFLEFGLEGPVHPRDQEIVASMLSALRIDEKPQTRRYRMLRKSGTYCWVETTAAGYVDPISLEVAGFVATVRDISVSMERELNWSAERIALAREKNQLKDLAWKDELTGVANRRSFNELMRFEVERKARTRAPLSMLMVDVDYFKLFNDKLGHSAGDECLRAVAAAMLSACERVTDTPARVGGEEFAVVLAATPLEGALLVAEKIRTAIAALKIVHPGSPVGYVTVSIGVATAGHGTLAEPALLMQAADEALYASKKNGRDRVTATAELAGALENSEMIEESIH